MVKKPYEKSDYYLGTICTLRIYNKDKEAVLDKAFARIKKSENQATLTKSGSELDKINDNDGVKPVQ
ncbi:MAG: FAD:protein FMN transferase, partial [Latilactobacillus curvatus]|nr:FAD:protein FMN transferase [Latilactobacillus curvatus]